MATLDTSIYNVRPKSVEDFNAEADAADARKMQAESNRLALALQGRQMAQMDRAERDENDLRTALAGAKSADDAISILRGRGRFEQADKLETSAVNRRKADSELKTAELTRTENAFKHYQSVLGTVQDPKQAEAFVVASYNDPIVGPMLQRMGPLEEGLGRLRQAAATPEGFREWQARAAIGIQKLAEMAKVQNVDSGGKVSTQVYNPATGAVTTVASTQKTVSPDAVMSATTARRGQDMADRRAREANVLKAAEIAGNQDSGAPVLGVPVPTVLPWSNQSNPKDANKVKAAEFQRGSKEVEKDVDAARKESSTADAARRFLEINKRVDTGGITDKFGLTRALQSIGSDYSELESITARLAPGMREPGSGATSDFDGKQFERATVGVDKPRATNENIAQGIIARAQQSQDYADFRQTYLEQNGTLTGADRYWKQYVDANPIFDRRSKKDFALNPSRQNWRDYFGRAQSAPGAPAPGANPTPAPAQPAPGGRPSLDSFNR